MPDRQLSRQLNAVERAVGGTRRAEKSHDIAMSVTEIHQAPTPCGRPMKLLEALNIIKASARPTARQFSIDLVCGFAPLHLKTFLAAHLQLLCPDRRVSVNVGLYGDTSGNLERAAASDCDVVAVALEWPDFDPRLGIRAVGSGPTGLDDLRKTINAQAQHIQQIIERRLSDIPIALSLPSLGTRAVSSEPGCLATGLDCILLQCTADFIDWALRKKNIRILSPRRLDDVSPSNRRRDVRAELATGFPYQLDHASVLAELMSRLIYPPVPRKGLITDLDDTLWSGVLGEIGVDGISWSLDRRSHVHALYQQQLASMLRSGVLVAAASKNELGIVEQAFARADLLLDGKQIFPVEAGWGPKSAAIHRILQAWNVGAESVVFVDDDPLEIAEVQPVFPEMECLLFPKGDPKACIELIARLGDLFGKHVVSEEDRLRRSSVRAQASLPKDLLAEVEAEIVFMAVTDPDDARPLELVNKTNQFNLNGRRYTEMEWLRYLRDGKSRVFVVSYKDRYGALGRIAVLGAQTGADGTVVDIWVMSCRAFSRRIEHQCLRQLFARFGVDRIVLDFEPTSRNMPLVEFFSSLLGSRPGGRFELSQRMFEASCPPLFHTVRTSP
jgi:FkbH-like protein